MVGAVAVSSGDVIERIVLPCSSLRPVPAKLTLSI
jgi:hypothetical protein